jgi:hypothetical protein
MVASIEGRIPDDVLDAVAASIRPIDHDSSRLIRVLEAYGQRVDRPEEPLFRARLAELYCQRMPAERDRLLTCEQNRALERCAEGAPYVEET